VILNPGRTPPRCGQQTAASKPREAADEIAALVLGSGDEVVTKSGSKGRKRLEDELSWGVSLVARGGI
jgi:hypothetical protein